MAPRLPKPFPPVGGGTRAWSHKDPKITVNGLKATIELAAWSDPVTANFANYIIGPARLDVGVPVGASHSIQLLDDGWGTGYDVHWYEDSTLSTGTDSRGNFADVLISATLTANLDPETGHEWRVMTTAIPINTQRASKADEFRSNSAETPFRIRI